MAYCPQCGREVLADDAHVCYHCKEPLTEKAPSSFAGDIPNDVDQELFLEGFAALLDKEIASITSSVAPDTRRTEQGSPGEKIEVRRQVNHVRFHAVGYGKGLMQMMMTEAEEANPGFSYDDESYSQAYQWVQQTVDDRREYIQAALQEDTDPDA